MILGREMQHQPEKDRWILTDGKLAFVVRKRVFDEKSFPDPEVRGRLQRDRSWMAKLSVVDEQPDHQLVPFLHGRVVAAEQASTPEAVVALLEETLRFLYASTSSAINPKEGNDHE